MGRVVEIHVEIDPFALRRDFKLLVAADVGEVVADKNFGDIPVPELPGFSREIGVGLEVELSIRTHEEQIEILPVSTGEGFRFDGRGRGCRRSHLQR